MELGIMHRRVMEHMIGRKLSRSEEVDHQDGNGLNNVRSNLRVATKSQNQANRRVSSLSGSGYKGVYFRKSTGRYTVYIKCGDTTRHIGVFNTVEEAAYIYDQWALQIYGEFARTNFVYN